ncbi:unnamed protein product [Caretta caretta]
MTDSFMKYVMKKIKREASVCAKKLISSFLSPADLMSETRACSCACPVIRQPRQNHLRQSGAGCSEFTRCPVVPHCTEGFVKCAESRSIAEDESNTHRQVLNF